VPIELQAVSFGYPDRGAGQWANRPVFDDLSLAVVPGCMTALVGPNGAGKSTLVRLMLGDLAPLRGRVVLHGRDVLTYSPAELAAHVAYVPQRTSVGAGLSVRQYVALGRLVMAQHPSAIDHALEAVGLGDRAADLLGDLSVGQQQLATLARVMAQLADTPASGAGAGARVILADEPTSAMDPRFAQTAMLILRRWARKGDAVVVVLHDLSAAARWCDQAIVLAGPGLPAYAGPAEQALDVGRLSGLYGLPLTRLSSPARLTVGGRLAEGDQRQDIPPAVAIVPGP